MVIVGLVLFVGSLFYGTIIATRYGALFGFPLILTGATAGVILVVDGVTGA